MLDPFDTWAKTNSALSAIKKLFILLHDQKPPKEDVKKTQAWEAELVEVRQMAIAIHYRRIILNLRNGKA